MNHQPQPSEKIIRTTQALGFLLSLDDNHKMNRLMLIKLLWAADRLHIRRYGRTITNLNDYYAMAHGPVCSLALDIAQMNDIALSETDINYLDEFFTIDAKDTSMQKNPGTDHLSESDKESLEKAWNMFKNKDPFDLADRISHQYPEWAKYGTTSGRQKIDMRDFFENPKNDQYFKEDSESLAAAREIFAENQQVEQELNSIFA